MGKTTAHPDSNELSEVDLLRALLVLNTADRDDSSAEKAGGGERSEVVLARAGFSASQIAAMTGRGYEAVRGTIRRSRDTGKGRSVGEST